MNLWTSQNLGIVALVFFSVYVLLYWSTPWFAKDSWHKFVQSLFSLGVIFTVISIAVDAAKKEEEQKRAQLLVMNQNTELYFTDIINKFALLDPFSFPLYREMNPQNPEVQKMDIVPDLQSNPEALAKSKRVTAYLANIIFQRMENVIQYFLEDTSKPLRSNEDFLSWQRSWQQWLSSPTLRDMWKYDKVFYSQSTQEVIDNIIRT